MVYLSIDFLLRFSTSPGNLKFSIGVWRKMQGSSVGVTWMTFDNEEVI